MDDMEGIGGIDSEFSLDELIKPEEQATLAQQCSKLIGREVRIARHSINGWYSVPLLDDFEPLGYLCSETQTDQLGEVAQLINARIRTERKYRMASGLHEAVVASDFQALSEKHEALKVSEARYRELSTALEQRVAEQVKTIKLAERKLYQADKLASVGQLAAGVAHEINNPIGFVTSNLNMAREYIEQLKGWIDTECQQNPEGTLARQGDELGFLFEDFEDLLSESMDGCSRVTRIVRSLKDFSNVDGQEVDVVSLDQLVGNVCELFATRLPDACDLKQKLGQTSALMINPGMISQMLGHLLMNAIEAVKNLDERRKAQIVIRTEQENGAVRLSVADNGCGMAARVRAHAFDPFFTTRPVGSGTGLGLSVCRDIVTAHDGEITLSSELGKGTVVTVVLPEASGK